MNGRAGLAEASGAVRAVEVRMLAGVPEDRVAVLGELLDACTGVLRA